MYEPVESTKTNNLPSKRKFARTFRILSRISFWVHIILGTVSAVTLFLVIFSRGSNNNSGVGIGTFIIAFSLIALGFRIYWAWRYRRIAQKLQRVDPEAQPSRAEVIEVLLEEIEHEDFTREDNDIFHD